MNLPPESGQAGLSSTSSMNGRSWLQIPMGAYLAPTGSARPIGFALFSPRNFAKWRVADFLGFSRVGFGWGFCIGSISTPQAALKRQTAEGRG